MSPDSAPLIRRVQAFVPAQGTAGAAQDEAIGKAPFNGVISAVSIIPEANLVGDNTNNRTFRAVNKGQTGVGAAVAASLQTTAANGLTAFDEKALTLSGTPANLVVAQDDVIALDEIVAGTGVAHSGYTAIVEFTRS